MAKCCPDCPEPYTKEWQPEWVRDKDPEPGWDEWDKGLNFGLVERQHATLKRTKEGGLESDRCVPPAYYVESGAPIRYAKAIAYAIVLIAPYVTIFDQLSNIKPETWIPCNNHTCHYMRLFNSRYVPASGVDVMTVQNGIDRPVALRNMDFEVYACDKQDPKKKARTFAEKFNGEPCPQSGKKHTEKVLKKHPHTRGLVDDEAKKARDFTITLRASFYSCKAALWVFAWPVNILSKTSAMWGMEHIPDGRCPHMTQTQMQAKCDSKQMRAKVVNHLAAWTPSKFAVYIGLGGFAFFTALHDVLLLRNFSEMRTLQLAFISTVFLGIAAGAVFFWAMGATEIFVAPVDNFKPQECMCFYQMPEMTALLGLATPFGLYVTYKGQVQMRGLAKLFGDYLSFMTFYAPHYLARQSFLWTWATFTTPKMAGTIRGEPRQKFTPEEWATLFNYQWVLNTGSTFLIVIVALTAAPFVTAFKELCVSLYVSGGLTPMLQNVIKFGVMPIMTLATIGIGFYAFTELKQLTVNPDPGETFLSQVKTILPKCCHRLIPKKNKEGPYKDQHGCCDSILGKIVFIGGTILLIISTVAVAQGLCPDRSFLLGQEGLNESGVAQAELWGSCGFIFFLVHFPRILSIGFSTWDDLESLKWLSGSSSNNSGDGMGYGLVADANSK